MVAKNYEHLSKIVNKDRLNIIKILVNTFWKRLSPRQIAQFLIIIGNPTFLGDSLRIKL